MARNNPKRNPLSPLLRDFLETNELELVDVTTGSGPIQTYEHKTLKNSSYLDHIAIIKASNLNVDNCIVHHKTASNMSDHQPVSFEINIQTPISNENNTGIPQLMFVPKFAWADTNFQQQYQEELSRRLCSSENEYSMESEPLKINKILIDSAQAAFSIVFPERQHEYYSKQWWTPELSRSKKLLSTHFNIWKRANFPKEDDNVIFNRYKLARTNFRKAVKAAQNKLVYDKFMKINSLKKTDSLKFWTNMRKLKENNLKRPYSINGKESDEEITREFADHFKTLLNNPRGSATSKHGPLPQSSNEMFTVSSTDIDEALCSLKRNKSNDFFGILAEHFIHAKNQNLHERVAALYTDMFSSERSPSALSMTTLLPLVKSYRKSLKSSNNYRGISLIPILTKLLEYIILKKCPEISDSNVSQFGFKWKSSTQHAEFLIHETVKYYNNHGSTVYMCSLDAEKAFDSCDWNILFEKLYYEKHVPLPVVKVLQSLYEQGTYQVQYRNNQSYQFGASQGVFQGSILSPHFYNTYTEELLEHLNSSSEAGTTLFGTFTGIVAYADDVILMSPTVSGLQHLLNECIHFYNNNAITLNIDKTEFISSGLRTPNNAHIDIQFHQVYPGEKLKHLGFIWNKKIYYGTLNDVNITERMSKFWSVVHGLIKGGIRFCQPDSIIELFKTLAIPTLTNGLELTQLTQTQLDKLDVEGRKAIKFLFDLSGYSKNHLNHIYNIDNISLIITNNKFKLVSRLMDNHITRNVILCTLRSTSTHQSVIHDCYNLTQKHGVNFYDVLLNNKITKVETMHNVNVPEEICTCLKFWHVGSQRKRFKDLMEDRVIRSNVS